MFKEKEPKTSWIINHHQVKWSGDEKLRENTSIRVINYIVESQGAKKSSSAVVNDSHRNIDKKSSIGGQKVVVGERRCSSISQLKLERTEPRFGQ